MKKGKIYTYDCNVYPRMIWIIVGGDIDFVKNHFINKYFEELNLEDCEDSYAITYNVIHKISKKFGVFIWILDKNDLKDRKSKIITHESFHAAMEIFNDTGCVFDYNNQEPFTYLSGFIADCIEKSI